MRVEREAGRLATLSENSPPESSNVGDVIPGAKRGIEGGQRGEVLRAVGRALADEYTFERQDLDRNAINDLIEGTGVFDVETLQAGRCQDDVYQQPAFSGREREVVHVAVPPPDAGWASTEGSAERDRDPIRRYPDAAAQFRARVARGPRSTAPIAPAEASALGDGRLEVAATRSRVTSLRFYVEPHLSAPTSRSGASTPCTMA